MANNIIQTKEVLKGYFETGDKPSEIEYRNLIHSLRHVNDKIGLQDLNLEGYDEEGERDNSLIVRLGDFVDASNGTKIVLTDDAQEVKISGNLVIDGDINATGHTVTADVFDGNLSIGPAIVGNSTGDSNASYLRFVENDGTTQQGWIGFGSSGNQHLQIYNNAVNKALQLRDDGTLFWGTDRIAMTSDVQASDSLQEVTVNGNSTNQGIVISGGGLEVTGSSTFSSDIKVEDTLKLGSSEGNNALNSGTLDFLEDIDNNFGEANGHGFRFTYNGDGNLFDFKGGNGTSTNTIFSVSRDDGEFNIYRDLKLNEGYQNITSHWHKRSIYHATDGILIETDVDTNVNKMIELIIEGNSYANRNTSGPIISRVQAYNYTTTGTIVNSGALSNDPDFTIDVFHYNGKVYFWFEQTNTFQTYSFKTNAGVGSSPVKIVNVTNALKPSTGVTNNVSITPIRMLTTSTISFEDIPDRPIWNWGTSRPDITGLTSGSTFGTILEGAQTGHITVGIRGNDPGDSFWILETDDDINNVNTYTKAILRVNDTYFQYKGNDILHTGNVQSIVDDNFVTLDTAQTIAGYKTFTDTIRIKNGSGIRGTSTGNDNSAFFTFYESNNTTRQGWIGFGSILNSNISMVNDVSGGHLKLDEDGNLYYNDQEVLDTGNHVAGTDYVSISGNETISGAKTFTQDVNMQTAKPVYTFLNGYNSDSPVIGVKGKASGQSFFIAEQSDNTTRMMDMVETANGAYQRWYNNGVETIRINGELGDVEVSGTTRLEGNTIIHTGNSESGALVLQRHTYSNTGDDIARFWVDDMGLNFLLDNDSDSDTGIYSFYKKVSGTNNLMFRIGTHSIEANLPVNATGQTITANNFVGSWESNDVSDFVSIDGAQTITGAKTFSQAVSAPSFRPTNIVTNRIVKFDGLQFDDSSLTDDGTTLTVTADIDANGQIVTASNFVGDWHGLAKADVFSNDSIKAHKTLAGNPFDYDTDFMSGGGIHFSYQSQANHINAPHGGYWMVQDIMGQSNAHAQLAFDIETATHANNSFYFRKYNNTNSWSNWVKVLNDENFQAGTDYVSINGSETITGPKTFSSPLTIQDEITSDSTIRTSDTMEAESFSAQNGTENAKLAYFGVEFNRITNYLRPTSNNNKDLWIGGLTPGTQDWSNINFRGKLTNFYSPVTMETVLKIGGSSSSGQLLFSDSSLSEQASLYYDGNTSQMTYENLEGTEHYFTTGISVNGNVAASNTIKVNRSESSSGQSAAIHFETENTSLSDSVSTYLNSIHGADIGESIFYIQTSSGGTLSNRFMIYEEGIDYVGDQHNFSGGPVNASDFIGNWNGKTSSDFVSATGNVSQIIDGNKTFDGPITFWDEITASAPIIANAGVEATNFTGNWNNKATSDFVSATGNVTETITGDKTFSGNVITIEKDLDVDGDLSVVSTIICDGHIRTGDFRLTSLNIAPISSTDTGTTGEIRYTVDHIYLCTATNTWKRIALSTW